MFSDLMTAEGYTYDYQFDWLLKKSDREALLTSTPDENEEEEEKEKEIKDSEEEKAEEKLEKLKLSSKKRK